MAGLSPMMAHYMETKREYPDCLLFYRLGDFYEMFFEDAITASRELEIALTGKECGLPERAPMCGIPHHAVDSYLYKLVQKGYKVAIAEQMEDPKHAKGLVKREVVRVVTPGTITSSQALDAAKNNFLMGIAYIGGAFGVCACDITTGDCLVTEVEGTGSLLDEVIKFAPSEIVCNEAFCMSGVDLEDLKNRHHVSISTLGSRYFSDEACRRALRERSLNAVLNGAGVEEGTAAAIAVGAVMGYLCETQKSGLPHITAITAYSAGEFLILDATARRNLELAETLREKRRRGSLLWVLDKTETAMGARLMRSLVERPLISKAAIVDRQNAIEELNRNGMARDEIRECLRSVYDLERLMGRISCKSATPRDLNAFCGSLKALPFIRSLLEEMKSPLLRGIWADLDPLKDLQELIERSIVDDPPLSAKEGGVIREGCHEGADRLRHAKTEGKSWLAQLESQEREQTGIKNLKIKFNKVFGYYFEVTNSFKGLVPEHFIRKQTLANAERYTTDRLGELEETILGAEDKLFALEYELFCGIRDQIEAQAGRVQGTAKALARADVFCSLALVAAKNGYVKPGINEKGEIRIKNGRHPVVELMLGDGRFVANDTVLDGRQNRISIITGPNMAGKSTYMRQTALIVLMAQMGGFVPADEADIGICDRIFTRVGASDDLASGQSTFMVEMAEVANILKNATRSSLIILDEIGRGTSTFDGLSIAWAVAEYISDAAQLGAKTLFATHYHELTELEGSMSGVNNYCIAVKERGDDIVFLRKIIKGGADKSYGIQVAKLAGLPERVIARARELMEELSGADIAAKARDAAQEGAPRPRRKASAMPDEVDLNQMTLSDAVRGEDIIKEIEQLRIDELRPVEALNILNRIQGKLRNRWQGRSSGEQSGEPSQKGF